MANRETQVGIEVLQQNTGSPHVRATQVGVEVLQANTGSPHVRATQIGIEVLQNNPARTQQPLIFVVT